MKRILAFLLFVACLNLIGNAQTTTIDTAQSISKILLIPFHPMMYFSDADPDISRFSKMGEPQVRVQLRNELEKNVYHQLLSRFDVVSLLQATSLDGEKDLNRIYAATHYTTYSHNDKKKYQKDKGIEEKSDMKSLLEKYTRKSKEQTFWVVDSSVMLGVIGDKELFAYLFKKYNHSHILFITQFEINTSNKNSIEWTKQQYTREYTIHYNLFDKSGALIRAEVLTIKAGNENTIKEITENHLRQLAAKLKEFIVIAGK